MKKIVFVLGLILTITAAFASYAYATGSTMVYCNDEPVVFEEGPYLIDGFTFVPVRALSDSLGFGYSWDDANKTVILTSEGTSAWIQANNFTITVNKNGVMYAERIDVAPRIINSRIFIPLRAIAELFDATVTWDSATSSVRLVKTDAEVLAPEAEHGSSGKFYISDFTPPVSVTLGASYILSGTVTSELAIDRLNVKIIDSSSQCVEINETAFDINSTSYSLADIDARITFGKLTRGAKSFVITCVDKAENRHSFSYDFVVVEPQGAEVNGNVHMLWPVPSSSLITTIFWCDNALCHSNAGRENGHAAIDISADQGAPVIASVSGVVKLCGEGNFDNGKAGYGNFVLLDHSGGLETQYSHLHEIFVTEGQYVNAGDIIGAVGSTGNSTGNHLDFYISQDGVRCDPLYYLDIPSEARCWEECDVPFFEAALASRGITK